MADQDRESQPGCGHLDTAMSPEKMLWVPNGPLATFSLPKLDLLAPAINGPLWPLLFSTRSQQCLPRAFLEQGRRPFGVSLDIAALCFHVRSCAEGGLDPFGFQRPSSLPAPPGSGAGLPLTGWAICKGGGWELGTPRGPEILSLFSSLHLHPSSSRATWELSSVPSPSL